MSDYLLWSLLFESEEADLPSYAPSPEDAESFEKELEGIVLDSHYEGVQFPTLPDGPFSTYQAIYQDSTPSLVGSTYTTDSSEDPATSEYSSMTYFTSSYLSPEIALGDVDLGSEYNDVDNSVFSLSPPSSSSDTLTWSRLSRTMAYQPPVCISPHSLSTAFPSPPPVPTDAPVGAASMQQAHKSPNPDMGSTRMGRTGPIRARFTCPHCGHLSARKHNLMTHMETHNPNRKKPFVCPESGCGHPFTRRHDLKRHLESMHEVPEK